MTKKYSPFRPSSHALALESRVLFDGAAAIAVEQQFDGRQSDTGQAEKAAPVEPAAQTREAASGAIADSAERLNLPAQQTKEIVFVSPEAAGLADSLANDGREVVFLGADQDGVAQIAQVLSGRSGVTAVHILSHGSSGQLTLGNSVLTANSMQAEHHEALLKIGQSLAAGADILIYGCDFAAGEVGEQAVRLLGGLTGADVAASTDATGGGLARW